MQFVSSKRFKQGSTDELDEETMPPCLRTSLNFMANSFNDCRSRNLDIMYHNDSTIYALMTNYDSNNFCWIQPTLSRTSSVPLEFDLYMKRINRLAHQDKLDILRKEDIKVGMDCVARYEVDNNWYRAVVVADEQQDQWLLLFVDYGNFQRTYPDQIARPVLEEKVNHYHASLQAVCCRLYNIVPRVPAARIDVDLLLQEFFTNNSDKFLEIKVKRVRPDFIVDCDIFLPNESKTESVVGDKLYRRHIGQACVDAGLASFADPIAAHSVKTKIEM